MIKLSFCSPVKFNIMEVAPLPSKATIYKHTKKQKLLVADYLVGKKNDSKQIV